MFSFFKKDEPKTIDEFMAQEAQKLVKALAKSGRLDFSEVSLDIVDTNLQEYHLGRAQFTKELHMNFSAYIFECAKKEFGGRYLNGNESNPYILVIGEPDFQIGFSVMEKVISRIENGPEDDIRFFYQGISPLFKSKKSATLI